MSSRDLGDEVVELARALIRIDTSNPPGNETPAAEFLADYMRSAGAEVELIGPDPERLNLIARVAGRGEGPSLMLMAHTDVVPAPDEGWTVPPFEGAVRDGELIGRGAADMKGELAARAAAIAALARSGERPAGDAVLVAESDEERNTSDVGMSWLVRERPDLRCDFAVNEGGGLALELAGGRRVVTVSIGEKLVTSLRIRLHGRACHASVPFGADNPLQHLAAAVEALLAHEAPARLAPEIADALTELGAPAGGGDDVVAWAIEQHPVLGGRVQAMSRLTVTPTGSQTFEPPNVIPPFADLICDCRALPGQTEADIREHVAAVLRDRCEYELEFLEPLVGGTQSPIETPLYRAIEDYVASRLPDAELLPIIDTGFSDSHWVRATQGTVAYGFAPVFTTDPNAYESAAHAADESIHVADLAEMAEFHLHALRALSGAPNSP
jgi:acetylornithine deacetylase/succinyl-diaminopimelate desuccinylase-like protein